MKSQKSKVKSQNYNSKLKTIQYGHNKSLVIDRVNGVNREIRLDVGEGEEMTYLLIATDFQGEKDVSVSLNGRGAVAQILGMIVGQSGELTIHTFQHHQAPDTQSDLLIKSVMFDGATLSYDGLIRIEQDAQRSNAYQRNENLLMSETAHVNTKPELEILANDVRCTHGATVGKIDEEVLFYVCSRGIEKREAEKLIIEGFLHEVVERIENQNVRSQVKDKIIRLLDGAR